MSKPKLLDESRLHKHKWGYRIVEIDNPKARQEAIAPTETDDEGEPVEYCREQVHIPTGQMLHRQFANLQDDKRTILAFANRYGLLGRVKREGEGELLSAWESEAERLSTLIDIHEGWFAKHKLTLDQEFDLLQPLATDRREPPNGYIFPLSASLKWRRFTFDQTSTAQFSARLLAAEVEWELAAGVDITVPELKPGATIALRPKDLLGAIYIHFLNEIIGSVRTPIKCGGCGRWYSPKDARSKYCSNACKVRQYRARKREEKNGN